MSSTAPTAFVTSATGTQGFAVARQLRALGWAVRATARNTDSPAVHALQALGVEFTRGDWADEAALRTAAAGCSHLFLNLIPSLATSSSEAPGAEKILDVAKGASLVNFNSEVPHAERILAVARAAGIKHVVYSSGVASNEAEKLGFYSPDNPVAKAMGWKKEVEGLVREAGFETWTILRGGFFMANFLQPKVRMYPGLLETSKWTTAMTAQTRIPMVDTDDLAKFVVAAFLDPARFHAQEIAVAGEFLTPGEAMTQLGEANGRDMCHVCLTDEEIEAQKAMNVFIVAQLMSRDMDKCVDLDKVKSWGIPMCTFRQFLEREEKALKETYP